MRSSLLLFIGTFISSLLLTPLVRQQAARRGVFDHPDEERRVHKAPMPRLGGVAIYLAVLLGCVVYAGLAHAWDSVWKPLLPATLIFLLGVADDLVGVGEWFKLLVPACSAALLYAMGYRITTVWLLPEVAFSVPGWLSFLLTLIWLVGLTNAFNLIDGVDGLAVGSSAIAILAVLVCSLLLGKRESGLLAAILLGALLGFLPYNFHPATIFLGDSGSLLIGFLTGALLLIGTQEQVGAISPVGPVIVGLPIVESAVTLLRRWLAGQALLPGDRGHFHHKLLDRGLSQRAVAVRLYVVGIVFAASGLLLLKAGIPLTILMLTLLGVGIVWGVRSLRYTEFRRD